MEYFWNFFAVGAGSFFVGMLLGRASGINALLMQERQQPQQPQMNPAMLSQMLGRPSASPPTGNGPG